MFDELPAEEQNEGQNGHRVAVGQRVHVSADLVLDRGQVADTHAKKNVAVSFEKDNHESVGSSHLTVRRDSPSCL